MGSLTDVGYQMALNLGSELRHRYIMQHGLLPIDDVSTSHVSVHSTAVRRTVTTLRGVLTGMYRNSSTEVRVAVQPSEEEIMVGNPQGCPALGDLVTQLRQEQARRGGLGHTKC